MLIRILFIGLQKLWDSNTIYPQLKQIQAILRISNKLKSSLHQGRKPETDGIENDISEWIVMNRSLGVSISLWEVQLRNVV